MNPSSHVNQPCLFCGKTTSMWCGRCQTAWYCTPEHLQLDWPRHRQECVPTALPTQPDQYLTVSALLFNPREEGPRNVPIMCRLPPSATPSLTPIVHEFFPESQPYAVILTQGLNGEPLRFPLHIFYCPQSLSRGAPVNAAIRRITGGAQAAKPWCGPVVVLKFSGSRRQSYADASANDFPALSAYFLAYK